jgi:beta-glucosidase
MRIAHFGLPLLALCGLAADLGAQAGSQNMEAKVNELLGRLTLEQKIDLLGGVDSSYTSALPQIGLPRLKTSDGPLGTRNDGPATAMPGGIALAATWDTALARKEGEQIGRDARARGDHFLLGPGVNIYVAPQNGRNFEYLGEDPFLAARLAVAYIDGLQSQGVSATIKHFLGNNSEYDRHNVNAIIDERALREIYLPVFEAAVKEAHVGAVMDSYNLVNGTHMTENAPINVGILKKEWGFDGVLVSDWSSTYDGVASANAGLDLEMPSGRFMNRRVLLAAIENNTVSVAAIDDKVRRILRLAVRFGWLDREQTDLSIPRENREGDQAALQVAREGMVLLKNERNLLPLNRERIKYIAVIGPDAYPAVPVGGGSAQVAPFSAVGFMQGLSRALGANVKVLYHRGVPTLNRLAMSTSYFTSDTKAQPGLTVERFDNVNLAGSPVETRTEIHVNQKPRFTMADLPEMDLSGLFAPGGPPPQRPKGSSTRWTGYYFPETAGPFEVFLQASGENGGHRLFIDGQLVMDGWKVRKATVDHATLPLTAAPHKVVFEQFSDGRPDFFGGALRLGIFAEDKAIDPAAKKLAAQADAVIVAAGFDPETESEGGDRTFGLPPGQDQLIRDIAAENKNTIVVLTSGGAVDTRGWLDNVPVLMEAWYAGQSGGVALADLLLGNVSPSGRLPISYDRSWEDNPAHESYYPQGDGRDVVYRDGVFVGYRGYDRDGKKPLFPFGYGLSYTKFEYSQLALKATGHDDRDPRYEVSFNVKNTGGRPGAEVAQVYVSEKHARVPRPPKELKAFARLDLKPGEGRPAVLSLDARSFAYYDAAAKEWRCDPGEFDILIGASAEDIRLRGTISLAKPISLPTAR